MTGCCQFKYNACVKDRICQTTDSVTDIIGKSFTKEFTSHNTDTKFHMTGIYHLNENVFDEDEIPVVLHH
jgi:hypothetical protein